MFASRYIPFVSMIAVALVLLACGDFSTSDPSGNAGGTASETEIVTSSPTESNALIDAPGLKRDYVAPLADAYRRIDPAEDGWQSETFSATVTARLADLAHWIESDDPKSDLKPYYTAETVASIHPEKTHAVFDNDSLSIERRASAAGTQLLDEALEQLRSGLGPTEHRHAKFKLYRVDASGELPVTKVLFQASGVPQDSRLQISAEWDITWTADENEPRISGVAMSDYESVSSAAGAAPLFVDRTVRWLGREAVEDDRLARSVDYWRARIPRSLGLNVMANHGIAIGDVNGDYLDDIYLCAEGGLPNRLFVRNRDGGFEERTSVSGADWLDFSSAALFVDFDNDGDRDLVVALEFRLLFHSNDGTGKFTLEFGLGTRSQTLSLAAADFDEDGDVDVYSCGYNPPSSDTRRGVLGEPIPFHDANNGGPNMLLRNEGNWEFNDVARETGLDVNNRRFSFAASWEDYDNDGDPDLYVANDYGRNNLYRNNGGTFSDETAALAVEDISAGMSVAWGDYNRDGRMDLYVSNMFSAAGNRITYNRQFQTRADDSLKEQFRRHARGNSLFTNHPGQPFSDDSVAKRVTMGRWAWGSILTDFNSDGWLDIMVANGFVTTRDTGDL